jgi:hypothetical protein
MDKVRQRGWAGVGFSGGYRAVCEDRAPWSTPKLREFWLLQRRTPRLLLSSRVMLSRYPTSPSLRPALYVMRGSPGDSLLGLGGWGGVPPALIPPAAEGPDAGWGDLEEKEPLAKPFIGGFHNVLPAWPLWKCRHSSPQIFPSSLSTLDSGVPGLSSMSRSPAPIGFPAFMASGPVL